MINANTDLQCYLFLFIGRIYSRMLFGVHRMATNFDVQRVFTAHQVFTCFMHCTRLSLSSPMRRYMSVQGI